ncbi:MAG: ABC transporter permease [Chloroflexi bacterium]|nr:ABC transporter permease [Chloroflexota bacterium]
MLKYALRRILIVIPAVVAASLIIFALIRFAPGDPVDIMFGPAAMGHSTATISQEARDKVRKELGLLEPAPIQYAIWLGRMARLDLGTTFKTRRPVIDELAERLPTTAKLAFLSFGILLVTAIPLGVLSAVNQGKAADHGVRFIALVFSAMPSFWLGLLLLYLLGVQWKVIDISGGSELKHLILPAIVMALGIVPTISRLLRASLISELGQLYIVFARAQGLSDGVVLWRHAVRVAVLPIMALLGLYLGGALGGSVIVESIFSIPGVGKWVLDSILGRDFPVVQAYMLLAVVIIATANLVVDLSYAVLDPRIRFGGRQVA